MLRLLHHCLISVCLAGSLILLPLCCAEIEYEYESTYSPDYVYNATFDYYIDTNSSFEELETIIRRMEFEDSESTVSTNPSKAFRTVYPNLLLTLILAAHQLLRLL